MCDAKLVIFRKGPFKRPARKQCAHFLAKSNLSLHPIVHTTYCTVYTVLTNSILNFWEQEFQLHEWKSILLQILYNCIYQSSKNIFEHFKS